MPNARTHDAITVVTGGILAPLGYLTLLNEGQSLQEASSSTDIYCGIEMVELNASVSGGKAPMNG